MSELFHTSDNWYRGNLHMHTTLSDGKLAPEDAAELYRKAGYDFIALTDHWVQGKTRMDNGFLILNGCEWDTGGLLPPLYHIVGVGMDSMVTLKRTDHSGPQQIINAIKNAGGIAILAHPAWSVTNPQDCLALTGLAGVEIYNSMSGVPWNGRRADSSEFIDICATLGKPFRCMAADDSHCYNGEQTRSFIMVKAADLSPDSIKKALADGFFYASQGPLFESICIEENCINVRCSQVETMVFYSNTAWCKDRVATGGITSASYQIKPTDTYVRVELIDKNNNMAWSSPISVNEGKKP